MLSRPGSHPGVLPGLRVVEDEVGLCWPILTSKRLTVWTLSDVCSARFSKRLAVDSRLAPLIVDRDVGVIPCEPGSDAEALGQVDYAFLGEPRLGGSAAVPEIDTSGSGIAVEVVFSNETVRGKTAVDGSRRGTTLYGLLLGSFRQIELDDDDAVAHEPLLHARSSKHEHPMSARDRQRPFLGRRRPRCRTRISRCLPWQTSQAATICTWPMGVLPETPRRRQRGCHPCARSGHRRCYSSCRCRNRQ
jgi:hypothetical protein